MYPFIRTRLSAFALALTAACGGLTSPITGNPDTQAPPTSPGSHIVREVGATLLWNRITRDLVVKHATGAAPAVRIYTLVAAAQDQAMRALPPGVNGTAQNEDMRAIIQASAVVLTYLYPAEAANLEAEVASQMAAIPPSRGAGPGAVSGRDVGRTVGTAMVERAKTDGFFAPFTGVVPICPGCWKAVPTPPAFATLGQARPWFLRSGDQFRPAPPPAFGSAKFLSELAEVRQIADTRTPAQDSIAKVWALQNGTVTTLGYWNRLGAELISAGRLNERRAARVLAVMNMAGYDVLIASHEAKYHYWLLRPSQADAGIKVAIGLPSFPAYPSNHAAISAAAAEVLGAAFPRERERLDGDAYMAGLSRIFGGIHYRVDMDAGLALGRNVAKYVLQLERVVSDDRPGGDGSPPYNF